MISRRAALAALVLVAAACGDTEDTSPSTTTTTTTSTSTTAPTTTTTAADACPSLTRYEATPDLTTAASDVDGDGASDQLRAFGVGGGDFVLQAELAAGGGGELAVPGDGVTAVALIGGADLDGDGRDEVWAKVGAGASATIIGLFRLDGCDLVPVTIGGAPAELPVGGSVGTTAGVECTATGILAHTASNTGGDAYEVTSTAFTLEDGALVDGTGSVSTTTAGAPELEVASGFTCGDLVL
jgi:hypothetical protein